MGVFPTRIWRRAAAWAVVAAAVFSLAACSNDPNPEPLQKKRADGSPWVVTYRAMGEDPRSLDPQYSYDVIGNAVIAQVYEPLLQYAPFKTDPYEVEPCLAESMPRRVENPDGTLSYEVRLKKGLRFQDDPCFPGGKGREVTSADFVYTFQRIADPKVECPVLSTLGEFIAGLRAEYEEAVRQKRFDHGSPTGAITVIDDHTFRINLLKPYPQLLYWLAMPFTAPVPREAVEYYNGENGRDLFKFHPVGAGPYRVAEWQRGRLIRLERHAGYHATRFPEGGWKPEDEARFRPVAGAEIPFIDELQFAIIREAIPAWLLFRQGYLDRSGVNKDVFNAVVTAGQTLSPKYEARGVRLYRDVEPTTFYLQFNMEDPVVGKNVELRRALSMAYDGERANQLFRNGVDLKAEQLLPPGVAGHDPDFKNPYRVFDLEKAKALLAQAGYPGGIDPKTGQRLVLTLDVLGGDSAGRQRAEFDKAQIEQLGVECRIEDNTWARFQDRQQRGAFQMNTGSGWHADYPDPENFLFLFYSKNLPPNGNNTSRFSNPEFDRLFEQMATMENGPERLAIIRRMNEIFTRECPVILTSHMVLFSLDQPWLPRVVSNAMLTAGLKYAQLDPALREEKQAQWNRAPMWPTWTLLGILGFSIGYAVIWVKRHNL